MNTVSSRLYLPDLRPWRLLLVGVLLVALVLLALGAPIVAAAASNQPVEPFRW